MIAGNMNKATVSGLVDTLHQHEERLKQPAKFGKAVREASLREARRIRKLLGWDDLPSYNKRPAAA